MDCLLARPLICSQQHNLSCFLLVSCPVSALKGALLSSEAGRERRFLPRELQLGPWDAVEDAELASWGQQGCELESRLDYSPG